MDSKNLTTPATAARGIVDSYRALALPSQQKASDPEKSKAIGLMVMAIGSHFWVEDVSAEQVALKTVDFLYDLADFTTTEIQSAFTNYRQDPKSKKFPTPGQIRELCFKERSERRASSRPAAIVMSRPSRWWDIPKDRWHMYTGNWHEAEVPAGMKVRDSVDHPWREPNR